MDSSKFLSEMGKLLTQVIMFDYGYYLKLNITFNSAPYDGIQEPYGVPYGAIYSVIWCVIHIYYYFKYVMMYMCQSA